MQPLHLTRERNMGPARFMLYQAQHARVFASRALGSALRSLLLDQGPELATGYAPVPGCIPSSTGSKPNQQIRFVACDEDGTSASGFISYWRLVEK